MLTDNELAAIRGRVSFAKTARETQRGLWLEHYDYDVPRLLADLESMRADLKEVHDCRDRGSPIVVVNSPDWVPVSNVNGFTRWQPRATDVTSQHQSG